MSPLENQLAARVLALEAQLAQLADLRTRPVFIATVDAGGKQWQERSFDNGTLGDFTDGRYCDGDTLPGALSSLGADRVLLEVPDRDTMRYVALPSESFLVKITGNAYLARASIAIGGGSSVSDVEYKWKYAWSEVERASAGTYAAVSGGRSGTTSSSYAINFAEEGNTSQYVWGVDVTGESYPLGFRPRPVGGGGTANTHRVDQIVEMHVGRNTDGTIFFWFDRIGSHDGDCA